MSQINYTLEVERAIYNWYFTGEDAPVAPVFNAIKLAFENDTKFMVPVHTPESIDEVEVSIHETKFKELDSTDPKYRGKYFIPIFTNPREVDKGEATMVVDCTLRDLMDVLDYRPNCVGFVINPWDKKMLLTRETLDMIMQHTPKSHVSFVNGSVIFMHVGTIVNAANESLLGGGGIDGAIHNAAGPRLLEACKELDGCITGGAKMTGAYNITNATYIAHAVGPKYTGDEQEANLLAACYMNALELAWRNHCMSVAFPCISTGVYGFPVEEAARISLTATVQWFQMHPDVTLNVYFNCFRPEELEAYKNLVQKK